MNEGAERSFSTFGICPHASVVLSTSTREHPLYRTIASRRPTNSGRENPPEITLRHNPANAPAATVAVDGATFPVHSAPAAASTGPVTDLASGPQPCPT